MFAFDQSTLPQLTTRKALIIVDFQKDFLDTDGALPVLEPEGFVSRTLELASVFRASGDVVWVQSRFEEPRSVDPEQIVVSDSLPLTSRTSRSRRSRVPPPPLPVDGSEGPGIDPEAFLSQADPVCLKPDTPGIEPPAAVKEAVVKSDLVLTKTHYSTFQGTHLLRMLRAKMVMEVFICGSLMNVGVYATALDAAGHGLSITIVENCCGYRSDSRQTRAVQSLLDLTGCEIASDAEVLESIMPKKLAAIKKSTQTSSENTPSGAALGDAARPSMSPDIVRPMTGLRLASDSPVPASSVPEDAGKTSSSTGERSVKEDAGLRQEKHISKAEPKDSTEPSNKPSPPPKLEEEVAKEVQENGPDVTVVSTTASPESTLPVDQAHITVGGAESTEQAAALSPAVPSQTPDQKEESKEPVPKSATTDSLQKELCAGDTDVIEDLLPPVLEKGIFYTLKDEVCWQRMSHQGGEVPRLVAVQGDVAEDGSMPVYRHPSDESPPLLPFSPTVLAIKAETEKHLGHSLNHVLIQYYRDGSDYISEHSDKTLDIVRGSYIANVSLGAERTMVLRTKRPDKDPSRATSDTPPNPEGLKRKIQRARLPHNSLCRMGLQTNMQWLHSIRQDKRADRDKTTEELAYQGGRISLTFRQIGTFLDKDESIIWGQGATSKTRDDAQPVVNGQEPEAIKMLRAFGVENHASSFDWDAYYGAGFNVLHITAAPRFFASGDLIVDLRIALMLAEHGIGYAKGSMASTAGASDVIAGADSFAAYGGIASVKFSDNDANKSTVQGDIAIMLYIDTVYGQTKASDSPLDRSLLALRFARFQAALALFSRWRQVDKKQSAATDTQREGQHLKDENVTESSVAKGENPVPLKHELAIWERYVTESDDEFMAGPLPSLPDFAVWPVLHAMVLEHGEDLLLGFENLHKYYLTMKRREGTTKALNKTLASVPSEG
ncbi:DNA oxidative demethylase ALKBH2 [Paramyrothecium foliicola]|nr:DNA oxidative demethylase ALKBH2 [Paramyrothecium foliicola]